MDATIIDVKEIGDFSEGGIFAYWPTYEYTAKDGRIIQANGSHFHFRTPLSDQFVVQSGRRRLEACRRLGLQVLALKPTAAGDEALADLEERFVENTMRRNLTGFEELLPVGLLAESLQELTQTEIAQRLGVPQGDVSLGLACLEYREQIEDQVDVAKTAKRQFRAILPKIRRGERLVPLLPPALTGDLPQPFDVLGIPMVAKKLDRGFAVNIKKTRVAAEHLEPMPIELAKVAMKCRMKSK